MVFTQRCMTACFNSKRTINSFFIETDGLINYIPVSALIAVMMPALAFDKCFQAGRSNRICYNRGTGMLIKKNCADQCNKPVAVNLLSVSVHNSCAVTVSVENDA